MHKDDETRAGRCVQAGRLCNVRYAGSIFFFPKVGFWILHLTSYLFGWYTARLTVPNLKCLGYLPYLPWGK